MKKIKLIAICGESGTGKTAVLEEVLRAAPESFNKIISHTTRPIRQKEKDGVTYHYVTSEEFADLVVADLMLEHTCFNGWLYGTSKTALAHDKINIGIFNPQGLAFFSAMQFYRFNNCLFRVFCQRETFAAVAKRKRPKC